MAARVTIYNAQAVREAAQVSTPPRVEIAGRIVTEARADAKVLSGQYRDGIHEVVDGNRVSVVDDDPTSIYKEYGTRNTPAHAALTNASMRYGKYTGWQPRGR